MRSGKLKIILMISSQRTSRIYLNILEAYLQEEMPDVDLSFFISQHDSDSVPQRRSSVIESHYVGDRNSIFLGLDGNVPSSIMDSIMGKKILIYLPEVGLPRDKRNYLQGYDYLITFNEHIDNYFQDECKRQNITILSGINSVFDEELHRENSVAIAKKDLCMKFPQINGKRILSIITRGTCMHQYLEKYKTIDIKNIVCQLPDDVIFMTNCRQIQLASSRLPYKYTNRYIGFGQSDLVNVVYASEWVVSNMAITESSRAVQWLLLYNGNEYEKEAQKQRREECLKPDSRFATDILTIINTKKNIPPVNEDKIRKSLCSLLRNI